MNGNDWHCIPDGTYESKEKAWDALEEHIRRTAEARDDDEEFQIWIVRREIERTDCAACETDECPVRLVKVA
jgi:hypothetical protein